MNSLSTIQARTLAKSFFGGINEPIEWNNRHIRWLWTEGALRYWKGLANSGLVWIRRNMVGITRRGYNALVRYLQIRYIRAKCGQVARVAESSYEEFWILCELSATLVAYVASIPARSIKQRCIGAC